MKEPKQQAQAVVIWLHGLGADASDMVGLADQLKLNDLPLRHVFIDAPTRPVTLNGGMVMPAWYDILGFELVDREDKEGIEKSEAMIRQVIELQLKDGFKTNQIFLAGFSQGGAMAMHTALHMKNGLGGVIVLSGYLPLATHTKPLLDLKTPFFMGVGQFDSVVLPKWTQQSREWLSKHGYEHITYHQYPMEHSICFDEIKDISIWFTQQITGVM